MEVLHDLLARPLLRVQPGVDDEADGAQHLVLQAAVVVPRILIEADLLAEALGVERPSLDVRGEVEEMLAELGDAGQLLGDGDLHVMAGHALVVRGRLHRDRLARLRLARVHLDAAGTRAVGRAGLVLRAGRFLLAERLGGHDFDLRARQPAEELRELRVHLVDVFAIEVEDLLARLGAEARVLVGGFLHRLEIVVAEALRDLEQLPFDAGDLAQADLVDLIGGEIRRRALADAHVVAMDAVGERPHPDLAAAVRRVVVLHERGELAVRGEHAVADRAEELAADAPALGLGDRRGEIRQRLRERRLLRRLRGDAGRLRRNFLEEELRRHEAVLHPLPHRRDRVVHLLREGAHALHVVVVVLRAVEGQQRRELRGEEVDAADLRDRHLPFLQLEVLDPLAEHAQHQDLVERLLLGEAGGVDGLEAADEAPALGNVLVQRGLGVVAGLVVVALVAEDRGELRLRAQRVLPMLVQEVLQRFAAFVEVLGGELGGGEIRHDENRRDDRGREFLHARQFTTSRESPAGRFPG